ncbi:MAG: transglycosylase domain-containing protein [Desulfobulbaceae bacterium]|nr:transglycosylase domain-containing protein [Desulfobulbaceae bacterium]
MLKKFFLFLIALASMSIIACVAGYLWWVVYFPGDAISQENIEKTLAMESPVLYSDGETKIGVFFQEDHRQYVPYEQLPKYFINGLIAAEDRHFFHHYGIDFPGFARAMRANISAGRIVQGGSTLTQQAAKNLFKRKGRSVKSKLIELLYALRLEYHYSKEKILEFYANQFYVSGNGRGLGVAARYYFDKEPGELDLIEAAFIAGSVKMPNYYNPFIKKDEEGVAKAKERAKIRTGYVLRHMYNAGMISAKLFQKNLNSEIPFNRGKMRFRLNTIMDLVKDGMDDPLVEGVLQQYGIDNVATSGIRVVTSIDKDIQRENFSALQSELARLDVRLQGYDRLPLQKRYADLPFGATNVEVGQFLVGRILEIKKQSPVEIEVSFTQNGHEMGARGVIDEKGLMHLLSSLVKYKKQRWSNATTAELPLLLNELQKGDLVFLSVRDKDPFNGNVVFNLEKYPELQGASLVLQKGKVLALSGGMDNYFYNRAISAKRPMGSVVKPLLYAAAIQLGWNSLDPLRNERAMFVYQNVPYIPRPDHQSPHKWVSMSWAGVHSENVASVWLLYHLCDRLTPAEFKELLAQVGMAREDGESYGHYKRRVRDKMGIVVNEATLQQAAFERAVASSEADLIFAGRLDEFKNLELFRYSDAFENLADDGEDLESVVRRRIVRRNFIRYRKIQEELVREASFHLVPGEQTLFPRLYKKLERKKSGMWWSEENALKRTDYLIYTEKDPGKGWAPVNRKDIQRVLAGMSVEEVREFWSGVKIEDMLSLETIDLIQENFQDAQRKLSALPAYEGEVLHAIHDFRVLAGLRYLISLCRAMGVTSDLEPVLSFPLGSNVISLLELARIYETLSSGMLFTQNDNLNPGLAVIDRIESVEGEVIFDGSMSKKRILDAQTALEVSDILRNVVKFGTGRYAKRNILLHSSSLDVEEQLGDLELGVPVLGKTGTANRFTNSSFAGVLPSRQIKGSGVILDAESFVIASYVGFDDNKPMVRNTTHITGATGALPVWTKVAQGIILGRNYAASVDIVDMAFSGTSEIPLYYPDLGQIEVPVAIHEGGVALGGTTESEKAAQAAPVVTFGKFLPGGAVEPERYFRPYWKNEAH